MFLKEKIPGFCELTEMLKHKCIEIFDANYKENNLTLNNNGRLKYKKRLAYYTVGKFPDSEETLQLIYDADNFSYYFQIETRGDLNGSYRIDVWLNELEHSLPKEMLDELYNEFYKFIEIIDE